MKRVLLLLLTLVCATSVPAVTLHRSFRPTGYNTGGGTAVIGPGFDTKPSIGFTDRAQPGQQAKPKVRSFIGKVTEVLDGDTVYVTPKGGARKRVVLDRIDAPEFDQPFGEESKRLLTDLVLGKTVDVKWSQRDSKGTTFGVLFVKHEKGAVDVNLSMILSGAAWYGGNADDIPAYPKAEANARAAKIGLWSQPDPVKPADWRARRKK